MILSKALFAVFLSLSSAAPLCGPNDPQIRLKAKRKVAYVTRTVATVSSTDYVYTSTHTVTAPLVEVLISGDYTFTYTHYSDVPTESQGLTTTTSIGSQVSLSSDLVSGAQHKSSGYISTWSGTTFSTEFPTKATVSVVPTTTLSSGSSKMSSGSAAATTSGSGSKSTSAPESSSGSGSSPNDNNGSNSSSGASGSGSESSSSSSGSSPSSSASPTSLDSGSNPSLDSGSNPTLDSGSNPTLDSGPSSTLDSGSNPTLDSGPSPTLNSEPSSTLSSEPSSTLYSGSTLDSGSKSTLETSSSTSSSQQNSPTSSSSGSGSGSGSGSSPTTLDTSSSTSSPSSTSSTSPSTTFSDAVSTVIPSALVYSPYNDDGSCKDYDAVNADLKKIAGKLIHSIRVYGTDCNYLSTVLPIASSLGLKVNQGFWFASTDLDPIQEAAAALVSYASTNGWDIFDYITIGNEAINSGFMDVNSLINIIDSVKSTLRKGGYNGLITTSEPPVTFEDYPELCQGDTIDFVGINPHSYFDASIDASQAGSFVLGQRTIVENICTEKAVKITETGYPSRGDANGLNVPSTENQKIAIKSILETVGSDVTILTMYNDMWKDPGLYGIEQYFGVYDILA